MSPRGAVSHQIKALEQLLDIDLFHRRHRGVELTAHGETLADVMHHSLSDIASTLDQISKADDDASVTIGATTATSSLWLTPRLSSFWKQHGNIPVNQKISDTQAGPDGVTDFVVRYGEMRSADPTHHLLFEGPIDPALQPVFCRQTSPGFAAGIGQSTLDSPRGPRHRLDELAYMVFPVELQWKDIDRNHRQQLYDCLASRPR